VAPTQRTDLIRRYNEMALDYELPTLPSAGAPARRMRDV
ncbi:MAG: hypothetical protein AVDCRST_MAG93-9890, partial [uncultured Chloroflexia bacterium]